MFAGKMQDITKREKRGGKGRTADLGEWDRSYSEKLGGLGDPPGLR